MADLSLPRRAGDRPGDRGQLVLVTGLAIAIAMVALVLLVNTAIYTQNLATRDAAMGEREALEYRASVNDGVGALIDAENAAEYDTYAAVESNASAGVNRTDRLIARSHIESGAAARINRSTIDYHEGRLIRQTDGSRNFTDASGLPDWAMALNLTDTRQFTATVDRGSLATTDAANATSDGFHVQVIGNVTGTPDEWNAAVYNNSSTGHVAVAVEPPSATQPTQVCSVDQSRATVDFTAGTLAGEPCPGMEWAEGVAGAYDINYVNGDRATGTYNLTVNVSSPLTTVNAVVLNEGPGASSPYFVEAVYDATFTIRFETPGLRYRDSLRVAPGESDA